MGPAGMRRQYRPSDARTGRRLTFQGAAQVTCFVPSATQSGHVHFVDGAGGGYTMAAKAMKTRRDALALAA